MAITVRVPTPLQRLTNGQGEVLCEGKTVTELLSDLERRYPGVRERICDQDGKLRRFVNVFVNEEDIRFLQGDQTAVKEGDEVSIIPAIAGGSAESVGLVNTGLRAVSDTHARYQIPVSENLVKEVSDTARTRVSDTARREWR